MLLDTRPVASTPCFGLHCRSGVVATPVLLMSVPKRLLRKAVDRNTVRRIAREAFRASCASFAHCALMLRLKRLPEGFGAMASRARKSRWRVELDRLFASARPVSGQAA